jgi:hypothetical protein
MIRESKSNVGAPFFGGRSASSTGVSGSWASATGLQPKGALDMTTKQGGGVGGGKRTRGGARWSGASRRGHRGRKSWPRQTWRQEDELFSSVLKMRALFARRARRAADGYSLPVA